jgi:hypothetical protein
VLAPLTSFKGRTSHRVRSTSANTGCGAIIQIFEADVNGELRVKQKYLSPPWRGNMLYLPPACDPALLRKPELPLIVTEGEFKTLALSRLVKWKASDPPLFLPVGYCWCVNWRGTIAKTTGPDGQRRNVKGPIPDLDWIT